MDNDLVVTQRSVYHKPKQRRWGWQTCSFITYTDRSVLWHVYKYHEI